MSRKPWRVIFLDVDGVLNHSACLEWQDTHHVLDPDCVRRVKNVCKRVGARIVISSVWRLSSESMAPLLAAFGELIIGVTPCYHGKPRRDEIAEWVTQHISIPLEMVVVDDESDAGIVGIPFVQTSFEGGGFTLEAAHETLAHFATVPVGAEPPEGAPQP